MQWCSRSRLSASSSDSTNEIASHRTHREMKSTGDSFATCTLQVCACGSKRFVSNYWRQKTKASSGRGWPPSFGRGSFQKLEKIVAHLRAKPYIYFRTSCPGWAKPEKVSPNFRTNDYRVPHRSVRGEPSRTEHLRPKTISKQQRDRSVKAIPFYFFPAAMRRRWPRLIVLELTRTASAKHTAPSK